MSSKPRSDRSEPPWLNHPLEIHLEPFNHNGKTYRVIGTRTEPHEQKLMNTETKEARWLPHSQVKRMQIVGITLQRDPI